MSPLMYGLVVVVLLLLVGPLAWVNARLALWVWAAWADHRDERRDAALMPHLERAHAQLRDQKRRLEALEAEARQTQARLDALAGVAPKAA